MNKCAFARDSPKLAPFAYHDSKNFVQFVTCGTCDGPSMLWPPCDIGWSLRTRWPLCFKPTSEWSTIELYLPSGFAMNGIFSGWFYTSLVSVATYSHFKLLIKEMNQPHNSYTYSPCYVSASDVLKSNHPTELDWTSRAEIGPNLSALGSWGLLGGIFACSNKI